MLRCCDVISAEHQRQWRHQTCLQEVWHETDLQIRMASPLNVNQSQVYTAFGKTIQYSVPDPLQLREGLHQWDQVKARDDDQEHRDDCGKGLTGRSAIAEHTWAIHHPIKWEGVSVVDQTRRPKELVLKEALHIQLAHSEERFNRDAEIEL